jgi:hypothetical protein
MTRNKALEVSRVLCRLEQLESQLDYLEGLPSEVEQETMTSHEFPAYGFTEEDMQEHIDIIQRKIKEQEKVLKEL